MFVANANNSYSEEKDEGWEFVKGKENEVGEVVVFQLEIPMRVVSTAPCALSLFSSISRFPNATPPRNFDNGPR